MKQISSYMEALTKHLKRYKYALLVLLLGMALLLIPKEKEEVQTPVVQEQEDYATQMELRLTDIMSNIEGRAVVRITEVSSPRGFWIFRVFLSAESAGIRILSKMVGETKE